MVLKYYFIMHTTHSILSGADPVGCRGWGRQGGHSLKQPVGGPAGKHVGNDD